MTAILQVKDLKVHFQTDDGLVKAAGLILFLLTLLVNTVADLIVNRSGRKGR